VTDPQQVTVPGPLAEAVREYARRWEQWRAEGKIGTVTSEFYGKANGTGTFHTTVKTIG
jgi:hypothetical protein